MASRTLPGLGLSGDWALGENNWKDGMDVNLLYLSVFVGRKALSRLSATPGAPVQGDIHIFKADHPTQANKVAVYDEGAWAYLVPVNRMRLYSVADKADFEYVEGTGWQRLSRSFGIRPVQADNYVATLDDADQLIPFNPAAAKNFTIPENVFEVGTRLFIEQMAAGQISFVAGGATVLNSRGAAFKTAGQWAVAQAYQRALNVWTITGDVAA